MFPIHWSPDLCLGHWNVWELDFQTGDRAVRTRANSQRHRGGLVDPGTATLPNLSRLHQARGPWCGQVRQLATGQRISLDSIELWPRLKFEYVYLQSGSILCKMYSWVKIISLKKFASPFLKVACIFSNNMFVLPLSLWLPTNSFASSEEILFLFSCNICCSCIKHNFKIILWWSYKGLVIWQKYYMILKGTKCIMIYRLAHKWPTIQ